MYQDVKDCDKKEYDSTGNERGNRIKIYSTDSDIIFDDVTDVDSNHDDEERGKPVKKAAPEIKKLVIRKLTILRGFTIRSMIKMNLLITLTLS